MKLKYVIIKTIGRLIGLTLILIGCAIMMSSFRYSVTENTWKLIGGFIIVTIGIFLISEMNQ